MERTTIQISQQTLNRLKDLKRYERESYDEVLNTLIDESEEELSQDDIEAIQQGLEEVKRGEVYSIEEVAEDLNVEL